MYNESLVDSLFEKAQTEIRNVISLDELAYASFDEFCKNVGETLNYTESQLLYSAAKKASQRKAAETRKRLVRANPQLHHAGSLDIASLPMPTASAVKTSYCVTLAAVSEAVSCNNTAGILWGI